MILVDSSVWIEFIRGRARFESGLLTRLATCGPVIQEGAIECGVAVMHRDRDFDTIARFAGLRVRR